MSDTEEGSTPQADELDYTPVTANEISNAPPPELPEQEKASWLDRVERHHIIRALALLTLIAGAVFSIFTFFSGKGIHVVICGEIKASNLRTIAVRSCK